MYARQAGESLEVALEVLDQNAGDPAATEAKQLLLAAYREPRSESEQGRQIAVENFKDKVLAICLATTSQPK